MSGPELAQEITKRHGPPRVVFMTGCADDAHVPGCGLAPNDILCKPFTEDELADAINAQLTDTGDEADPTFSCRRVDGLSTPRQLAVHTPIGS